MVVNHPLTEGEAAQARRCFISYVSCCAVARICTGTTVLMLGALQLGISSAFTSAIGSMSYLNYAVLPLGFVFAAKWGVCRSILYQRAFAFLVCLVLAGAHWLPCGAQYVFMMAVVLFFLHEASAAAMSFPIQKSITNEKTLPVLQAHGNICASSLSLASSLLTAWFMARVEGAVALPSLFILGGILFLLSGICMMRMNEQDTLCRYAAQPVLPEIHEALGIPLLRKQLAAGFVLNLMLVMMPAVCVLAAKEGCGLHDSEILVLTSMQVLSSVVAARCCQLGTLRWGAWTMIMATCPLVFVLGIYWWLVPAGCSWPCLIVPFVICGIISIFFSTSMGNYFIVSMPERLQIPGTFLLFVLTGGAPGLVGLVLNPTIFHFVSRLPKTSALTPYRWFFFIGTVLYLLGLPLILRLPRHYR